MENESSGHSQTDVTAVLGREQINNQKDMTMCHGKESCRQATQGREQINKQKDFSNVTIENAQCRHGQR